MKRLLALLLLAVAPAFAQQAAVNQTYTFDPTNVPLQNINQNGGTPITLYDDGNTRVNLPFEFYFFGNAYNSVNISQNGYISFTSNSQGCCDGKPLPDFASTNPYLDTRNSIFALWNDLADFNNPGNPYIKSFNDRFVVGWYDIEELGTANKFNFEITLFKNSYDFSINYGNLDLPNFREWERFTAGFQGDTQSEVYQIYFGNNPLQLENNTYTFVSNYNYIPEFLYWDKLTGENGVFTLTEPGVVRYGADGVYVYKSLEAGTYSCDNGFWGDPIGGVVKSCELGSNESPVVIVDCVTDPFNTQCVIDSITDEEPVYVAEETNNSATVDDEEELIVEELLADADPILEEPASEETLEELLADESIDEEVIDEEMVAEVRELANEEKASTLADSISKDVLEAALSVAADAVSAATTGDSATSSSSDSSSKSTTLTATVTESVVATTETVAATESSSENVKEESVESSALAALDILDTGRQIGQEALSATLAATESSANESMAEAQSIASTSSSDAQSSGGSIDASITSTVADANVTENSNQTVEQIETEIVATEQLVAEVEQSTEITIQNQENQSAVEFTTVEETMEMFAGSISQQAAATEQEELENSIVQQAIASSQTNEEENKMGFAEAEAVTIVSDPALANAFNVQPNTASLELLGVLGSKAEEKSDAELRAEQVVAANKEEQDAINANYMEAEQSGILAAIGSETDVSAYRNAMLQDANAWYKPEDIYKNIVIKDNVRGSYFLEKGNTDTYKKMVEEQYK